MTETTAVMTTGPGADVRAYVAQVREQLADLPSEDVDDLTLGMEADLMELASAAGPDLRSRLGTPQAYAAELRSAAGLPERSAPARPSVLRSLKEPADRLGDRILTAAPWLRELRGGWWLARAAIVGMFVGWLFYWSPLLTLVLVVVLGAASIWLGLRTRAGRTRWWPLLILNLLAALIALF